MFVRPVLDDFGVCPVLDGFVAALRKKYNSLPVWVALALLDASFDRASAGDVDRLVGGVFDGPESHAVFPRHRA